MTAAASVFGVHASAGLDIVSEVLETEAIRTAKWVAFSLLPTVAHICCEALLFQQLPTEARLPTAGHVSSAISWRCQANGLISGSKKDVLRLIESSPLAKHLCTALIAGAGQTSGRR